MADKSFDCVVVGSCVVDVLARPVTLAEPIGRGRLIEGEPLLLTTGGIVSNAGIAMARLGMRVAAFTYVGDDEWADVIRRRYAAEGIDTSGLMTHPERATSTSAVLIDPSGERSFLHCAVRRGFSIERPCSPGSTCLGEAASCCSATTR